MDQELPQTMGYEAAGIVDELGEGVTDVAIGTACSASPLRGRPGELAVLSYYAPIPPSLDFAGRCRTAGRRRDGRARA